MVVAHGGRCRRTGVAQVPYNCCPWWCIMSCCVHQLKHCNCDASAAALSWRPRLNGAPCGAPGLRAYWGQFVKKWPKNLNK